MGVGGGIFEEFELELDFRGTTLNAAAKAATITTVSIATRLQHSFFMMTICASALRVMPFSLAQIVKEKLLSQLIRDREYKYLRSSP